MGYISNHAIVVTGIAPYIEEAHCKAVDIFVEERTFISGRASVSQLSPTPTNAFRSFAVFPDRSKEGCAQREEFVAWLKDAAVRWVLVRWVLVQFGDDVGGNRVLDGSNGGPR